MKITRKLQRQVEAKIQHAITTGRLPMIGKSSLTGTHSSRESGKADGHDQGHAK